jgi:hypothetical protein
MSQCNGIKINPPKKKYKGKKLTTLTYYGHPIKETMPAQL